MRRPIKPFPLILGLIFLGIGIYACVLGVRHTISGEPIAATTRTKASTGPETLIFGLIGVGFGGFLAWRGLQGRSWPER